MKATKIVFMAVCLFFAGHIFASGSFDSMKDRTDSWLQDSEEPSLRGSRAVQDAEGEVGILEVPAHDALYILLALAGVYILVSRKKKTLN